MALTPPTLTVSTSLAESSVAEPPGQANTGERQPSSGESGVSTVLSRGEINRRLAEVSTVLPISGTALNVYRQASQESAKPADIAKAIEQDASLAADVLRTGNSAQYNRSWKPFTGLEEVLVRVGSRRVAELALAASARGLVTKLQLPWLNIELAWRRSVAAGMVLDGLIDQGANGRIGRGLFLSVLMYPLGRIVLASLFPVRHEMLVRQCQQTGETLSSAEKRVFLKPHTEIMADLLAGWHIPSDISGPLRQALDPFTALRALPAAERTRVELVKVALQLGRLAVGEWEPWDIVEFPTLAVLERLRIRSVSEIMADTLAKIEQGTKLNETKANDLQQPQVALSIRQIGYWNAARAGFDFLASTFPAMGVESADCELECASSILVNGTECEPSEFMTQFNVRNDQDVLAVTTEGSRHKFTDFEHVLTLPTSFGRLQDFVRNARLCPADSLGRAANSASEAAPADACARA